MSKTLVPTLSVLDPCGARFSASETKLRGEDLQVSMRKLAEQKILKLNGLQSFQSWTYQWGFELKQWGIEQEKSMHMLREFLWPKALCNTAPWLDGFILEADSSWLTGLDFLFFELVARELWPKKSVFIWSSALTMVYKNERSTDMTN